jgi:hypothetical protein
MGMIFVNVNQVLVRLWARRGRTSDRMWSVLRDGSSRDRGNVFRGVLCACHRVALLPSDWGFDLVVRSENDPCADLLSALAFGVRRQGLPDHRSLITDH